MRRTFLCHAHAVRLCPARISSSFIAPAMESIGGFSLSSVLLRPCLLPLWGINCINSFFPCWSLKRWTWPTNWREDALPVPAVRHSEKWGSGACTPLTGSISAGEVGPPAHFRNLCLPLTANSSSWGVCQGLGKPSKHSDWFLQTVLPICVFKSTTLCG